METLDNFDDEDEFDYFAKLILVGNSAVGKTSILVRFDGDEFVQASMPTLGTPPLIIILTLTSTLGVDFKNKILNVGDRKIKI